MKSPVEKGEKREARKDFYKVYNISLILFVVLVVFGIGVVKAFAHTRSQSFSSWDIQQGQVWLSFSVQSLEATRLGLIEEEASNLNEILLRHLASHLVVRTGDSVCQTSAGPQARPAREGYLRVEWRFLCPANADIEIINNAFFDAVSSHVHYARVRIGDKRPIEYLFTNTERRRLLAISADTNPASHGASFVSYVWLGVEHILIGIDHVAFLLALLLLCRRVRDVALMVTGFTAGHSLTLSLAVLGFVTPNPSVIESLIGFTIALVAAENIGVATGSHAKLAWAAGVALLALATVKILGGIGLPVVTLVGLAVFTSCYLSLIDTQDQAARWRPMLTILFGLIHGFGFASVLLELRLPTGRLVAALLGFNLGVEIGQLGIVAMFWATGMLLARRFSTADYRLATDAFSAALCALGLFWFVGRALGH